jgi:flagellar M-ring protein FliF
MKDQIQAYLEKAREMWSGLDRNRKIGVGGGAGALVIVMLLLTMSGGEKELSYLPLYTDLDLKEAGQLANRLGEMNQDYKVGGDGTVIMVPERNRLSLRASLAAEGYPKTGLIGYEVFDEVPLGMTDFLQKVKMRQALEGELQKTILQLEQVEEVRLHVVIPEPSLFTDQEKPPTASLMLKLRSRMSLSRDQVEGVQRLVSGSVEGLSVANITVVDNAGNVLSEEADPLARVSTKQIEIQRDVEKYLEERTQSILDHILGPDQAFIRLNAELNFDQTEEEVQSYDSANPVLRSEERSEQSSAEAGTNETSVSNYEINQTIKRISGSPGTIRRISVSLMVNQNVPNGVDPVTEELVLRQRTAAEISKIVEGALGIDRQGRGDNLTISSFQFAVQDLRFAAEKKRDAQEREDLITNIVINIAKGIAIVIALLVLRAIIGAIGRGVAREEEIAMEAQRELADDDVSEELPETPHEILLGRIASLITERPEDAAKLIRTMLIEDTRASA